MDVDPTQSVEDMRPTSGLGLGQGPSANGETHQINQPTIQNVGSAISSDSNTRQTNPNSLTSPKPSLTSHTPPGSAVLVGGKPAVNRSKA